MTTSMAQAAAAARPRPRQSVARACRESSAAAACSGHVIPALVAIVGRESHKFVRQPGRLISSVVRPALWLIVFAAGFQNVFGVSIIPPYETYVEYKVYLTRAWSEWSCSSTACCPAWRWSTTARWE